jgi:hypothetical protein
MQSITRSTRYMSEPEPFYLASVDLFGTDAWHRFASYAADLEKAGLAQRFPSDPGLRNLAVELLAERHPVSDLVDNPRLIADAIVEAVEIRYSRRS